MAGSHPSSCPDGDTDGLKLDGEFEGIGVVGETDGEIEGTGVSTMAGGAVCIGVGLAVGLAVGLKEGLSDGLKLGASVGHNPHSPAGSMPRICSGARHS